MESPPTVSTSPLVAGPAATMTLSVFMILPSDVFTPETFPFLVNIEYAGVSIKNCVLGVDSANA